MRIWPKKDKEIVAGGVVVTLAGIVLLPYIIEAGYLPIKSHLLSGSLCGIIAGIGASVLAYILGQNSRGDRFMRFDKLPPGSYNLLEVMFHRGSSKPSVLRVKRPNGNEKIYIKSLPADLPLGLENEKAIVILEAHFGRNYIVAKKDNSESAEKPSD